MIIIWFRLYIQCCLRVRYEISCQKGPRHHNNTNYLISYFYTQRIPQKLSTYLAVPVITTFIGIVLYN